MRGSRTQVLSLAPLALVLAGLVLLPHLLILARSLVVEGQFGLGMLVAVVADPYFIEILLNSLWLGLLVVLGSTVLALPLAMLTTSSLLRRSRWIDIVLLVPFMTPPYINAMGWIQFVQPRGYFNQIFAGTGDISVVVLSLFGMALVMSLNLYPLMYFMLKNVLLRLSGSLSEAAAVHGAGRWYRFWRITARLLLSGYASGCLLVFVKALSEFGTPITVGQRIGFPVLVTEIYRYTSNWPLNFGKAATYSLSLIAVCLLIWFGQSLISKRFSYSLVGGKGVRLAPGKQSPLLLVLGLVYLTLLLLMSIGVPYFSIIATSFMRLRSQGLALDNFTLEHYQAIFASGSAGLEALGWSFWLSVAAASLAVVIGIWTGLQTWQQRAQSAGREQGLRRALDFVALLPNTVPSIVVVLGLILMWNASWMSLPVYNTPLMLVITYAVLFLPFTVQYVKSSRESISRSLLEASRVCGAGRLRGFWCVTLPLLRPGILSAWSITFAISFRELVGSLIIRPPELHTTATFIYGQFEQGSVGQGMAMAVVSVLFTSLILISVQTWAHHQEGRN